MPFPVSVRGEVYPSVKEAARVHKVTVRTCYEHLRKHGHLDYLNRYALTRKDSRKPVVLNGYVFESITHAAKALGVDRKTIRNMAHREAARLTVLRALMRYTVQQGEAA
jgi:hypothetical protein